MAFEDKKCLILGIDTSCDDTAASVICMNSEEVYDGTGYIPELLSSIIVSQTDIHSRFGGIVPELASREHMIRISGTVKKALKEADVKPQDLSLITATRGPGLMGSLLVGLGYGSSYAKALNIPFFGANHLAGHIHSLRLMPEPPETPFVALLASGGHTTLVEVSEGYKTLTTLGSTRDDAAGEAFDKVARLLNLGYPGGPVVQKAAENGEPGIVKLPRPMLGKGLEFSFSGLKTAVYNLVEKSSPSVENVAAEFQQAAAEILVTKLLKAAEGRKIHQVSISGGVSANGPLRTMLKEKAAARNIKASMPPLKLCTDNAAMIACAGHHYYMVAPDSCMDVKTEWPVDTLNMKTTLL